MDDRIEISDLESACANFNADPENEFVCFRVCNICNGKKLIKFSELREYNGRGCDTLVIPKICIMADDYLPSCACPEVGGHVH